MDDDEKASPLPPPFSIPVFESLYDLDSPTSPQSVRSRPISTQWFPASYRTKRHEIVVARVNDAEFIEQELDVSRLNAIHDWLWVVGRPMPPRSLHSQRVRNRDIIQSEQMDLHLVWTPKRMFIKPLPKWLLDVEFWKVHLCTNRKLYGCAMGFLLSYAALVQAEIDFRIAKQLYLLPPELKWSQWVALVDELLHCEHVGTINKRYLYGELRQGRLNDIYRFRKGKLRGYLSTCTTYGDFFQENLNSLIGLFAYVTIALSAMQVGLASSFLQGSDAFQQASYGFAVFSIVAPLFAVGILISVFVVIFTLNLIATLNFRRKKFAAARKAKAAG